MRPGQMVFVCLSSVTRFLLKGIYNSVRSETRERIKWYTSVCRPPRGFDLETFAILVGLEQVNWVKCR